MLIWFQLLLDFLIKLGESNWSWKGFYVKIVGSLKIDNNFDGNVNLPLFDFEIDKVRFGHCTLILVKYAMLMLVGPEIKVMGYFINSDFLFKIKNGFAVVQGKFGLFSHIHNDVILRLLLILLIAELKIVPFFDEVFDCHIIIDENHIVLSFHGNFGIRTKQRNNFDILLIARTRGFRIHFRQSLELLGRHIWNI